MQHKHLQSQIHRLKKQAVAILSFIKPILKMIKQAQNFTSN